MGQTMNDTPRNREDYETRKEPLPPFAVLLLLGLFTAALLFFGVPLIDSFSEYLGDK